MPKPDASYLAIYGRPLGGSVRRAPSALQRSRILEMQNGACLYCGLRFGTVIHRAGSDLKHVKGRRLSADVRLRINWDHFIPYSFLAANPRENWVAACHVCNGIKSSRMFESVAEAQRVIMNRRGRGGVVDQPDRSAATAMITIDGEGQECRQGLRRKSIS